MNGVISTDRSVRPSRSRSWKPTVLTRGILTPSSPTATATRTPPPMAHMAYQLTEAIALEIAATDISGDNEYDGCYDTLTFALIHDCDDDYEQRAWRLAQPCSSDHIR